MHIASRKGSILNWFHPFLAIGRLFLSGDPFIMDRKLSPTGPFGGKTTFWLVTLPPSSSGNIYRNWTDDVGRYDLAIQRLFTMPPTQVNQISVESGRTNNAILPSFSLWGNVSIINKKSVVDPPFFG